MPPIDMTWQTNFPRCRLHRRLIVIASALLAAACSGAGEPPPAGVEAVPATTTTTSRPRPSTTTPTSDATASTEITASTITTTTLPPIPRQPLTGVVLAEGELAIPRPALAVKIDNQTGARRNHRGLGAADIVFEEIVEANITRFAAVFHSQGSDAVGPIRSGRSQDVDLLTSFVQPLFAWSGGNPGVTRLIAESTFVDLNATRGGRGYYRGPGRAPHNLYNDTATLWSQAPEDHAGTPPPQQLPYVRPGATFIGDPVVRFELQMRAIDVEWTWDADTRMFLRSQEGAAHNDVLHGRIDATNVVVLAVEYRPSQIDARSPEAQTVGEGPAFFFSDGLVRPGRWFRETSDEPFQFLTEVGDVIELTPGNTWIELAEAQPTDDPANPALQIAVYLPE